jgi:hypothetical protein
LSFLAVIVGTQAANAQADINPNIYPPYRGAPLEQQPYERYPGPDRLSGGAHYVAIGRPGRGYGFMKIARLRRLRRALARGSPHRHLRQTVYR